MKKLFIGLVILLIFVPQGIHAQVSEVLKSATAIEILPQGHWVWPLTPALTAELHSMMDTALQEAKARYGPSQAKVVMLENSTSLMSDFATKAQSVFPGALVVGVGPGSENYNAFTTEAFAEHAQRSIALVALGGSDITRVQASGQKNVGQGSDAQQQVTAGAQIAQDLKPLLNSGQSNLIVLFGPGHTPNHKLILCGFKQGIAGVSNQCNTATPDNPELSSLPQLPQYVRVLGTPAYYNANTVVGTTVISQSVIGVLIQGNFRIALAGFGGTPTETNIVNPINQITQELGGAPTHLFLSPGHPTVGAYETLRQKMVMLLPNTTIFGHEGGGEIGHDQTTAPAMALTNHLFMVGLRPSGSSTQPGDANGDGRVDGRDYIVWLLHYGQNVTGVTNGDFDANGVVDGRDYIVWLNNYTV